MPYVRAGPNTSKLVWASRWRTEHRSADGLVAQDTYAAAWPTLSGERRGPVRPGRTFVADPIVAGIVQRVRERLSAGEHATPDEIKALAQAASAALCEHGNGLVRAEAAKILASLARHEEKLAHAVTVEAGTDRRHREKLELTARRRGLESLLGPPASGSVEEGGGPRLRLPRGS